MLLSSFCVNDFIHLFCLPLVFKSVCSMNVFICIYIYIYIYLY